MLTAVLLTANPVIANESDTTWRAGDFLRAGAVCHDLSALMNSVIQWTETGNGAPPAWQEAIERGTCFAPRNGIPIRLVEWLAGPFKGSNMPPLSTWEVANRFEDVLYIWLSNKGGKHLAIEKQAL